LEAKNHGEKVANPIGSCSLLDDNHPQELSMSNPLRVILALGLVAVLCRPSLAAIEAGNIYKLETLNARSEGPYLLTPMGGGAPAGSFGTFCVELHENFSDGALYTVSGVSNQTTSGKSLSGYTAWLYSMFRTQDGLSLPFTATSQNYDLLQQAIRAGMVGTSGTVGGADAEYAISNWAAYEQIGIGLSNFITSAWGGTTDLAAKLGCLGSVKVLNLVGPTPDRADPAQDQLALVPQSQPQAQVPEPASLVVWGMLAPMAWGWQRFRKGRKSAK
jgi:hypothetical protein